MLRCEHSYKLNPKMLKQLQDCEDTGVPLVRLSSAGLEPVLKRTEKSCIVSYYFQCCTNIKLTNIYPRKAVYN